MTEEQERWVDKKRLREIWPASSATNYRLMGREVDPFPRGKLIGGKRYWLVADILGWVSRQADGPIKTPDHLVRNRPHRARGTETAHGAPEEATA